MVALVLAGGLGRRFGGEKQWAPIDDRGQTLTDYALYDAYRVGADTVVMVVREQDVDRVASTIGTRVGRRMTVHYALQPAPEVYGFEPSRPPLGTGHAFLCGAQTIKEPFVLLNADDYYGPEAIAQAVRAAQNGQFACIAYEAGKTVGRGRANRAICLAQDGCLTGLCECTFGRDAHGKLYAADASCRKYVREDIAVSMNLFALQPTIVAQAAQCFAEFLQKDAQIECLLGDVITQFVGRTHTPVHLVAAQSEWKGITYRDDLPAVRKYLAQQVARGVYPNKLWN